MEIINLVEYSSITLKKVNPKSYSDYKDKSLICLCIKGNQQGGVGGGMFGVSTDDGIDEGLPYVSWCIGVSVGVSWIF